MTGERSIGGCTLFAAQGLIELALGSTAWPVAPDLALARAAALVVRKTRELS